MNGTLAPKSLEGILRETFSIYKSNFLRLIAIVAIVQVPIAILAVVANLLMPVYGELGTEALSPFMYFFWIPIYLALFIASILMAGAVIHAVSEQYFNRPVSIGRAYGFAWHRLGDMFWAVVLVTLAILGIYLAAILISIIVYLFIPTTIGGIPDWLIAFVISGTLIYLATPAAIYLGIIWHFVMQTALLEGCSSKSALSRSSVLVKGSWWRVLGIVLLLGLIVQTIGMIFCVPAIIGATTWVITGATAGLPTGVMIWAMIGGTIGGILSLPIFVIGQTLLYFDLRVRKQGYSFDALADELGLRNTSTDTVA